MLCGLRQSRPRVVCGKRTRSSLRRGYGRSIGQIERTLKHKYAVVDHRVGLDAHKWLIRVANRRAVFEAVQISLADQQRSTDLRRDVHIRLAGRVEGRQQGTRDTVVYRQNERRDEVGEVAGLRDVVSLHPGCNLRKLLPQSTFESER